MGFTFQSGSIQISREIFFELIGNIFTFQSGSIQMTLGLQRGIVVIALHSNLVLFK